MKILLRAAVLATALLTGAVAAPASAHAGGTGATTSSIQRFYADSGDRCPMGFTQGTLEWRSVPFNENAVDVRGEVVDRPLPDDPSQICGDDRRFTVATFDAFSGTTLVDREERRVDNGRLTFSFSLTSLPFSKITSVVVQVCRHSFAPSLPVICGPPQEYRPV